MRKLFRSDISLRIPWDLGKRDRWTVVQEIRILETVGIAICGEIGTQLTERLALPTSPTTLLRRLMAVPTETQGLVT
jgi:hypothetical protein